MQAHKRRPRCDGSGHHPVGHCLLGTVRGSGYRRNGDDLSPSSWSVLDAPHPAHNFSGEVVKRELRTTGSVPDSDAHRALMNVRAQVNERDGEAIHWLRQLSREEEARRLELMQRNLPPVRSEKQIIANVLIAQKQVGLGSDKDRSRSR